MKEYFSEAFYLNGLRVTYEDLGEVAYSLVKEGEPYEQEIGDFLLDWISADAEIQQLTSGTTGAPKTVHLRKAAMVRSAMATGAFLQLGEGTSALLCLPARTIAGKMMLVRAFVLGWKLYLVPPSGQPLEGLDKTLDFAAMVPLQLYQSLGHLDKISTILVGGGRISAELRAKIPGTRTAIYESFGMTETASHIALRKLSDHSDSSASEEELPLFQTLPGITVDTDERGCLLINAHFLSDTPIVTNDLVVTEGDDRFKWLGRADHIVNSGGIKLIPEPLEAEMGQMIPRPFFLAGMPDPVLGEKLVLVVEGTPDPDLLEVIRESKELDTYEIPKELIFMPEFSRTETGKINRGETLKILGKN